MIKKSYLYISLTVLLWGSTAAVAKLLLRNLNNLQLLLFASLIAFLTLFIIVIFQNKIEIIKNYTLNDYIFFAFMAFIGIFLYHVFLFTGLTLAPVQEAFIVNYTWPIWVVIFAVILLKEELFSKKIIAISICFIGVYIVISKGNLLDFSFENINGDIYALAGAICYGLYSVLGKRDTRDVFTSMMFYYLFAFIYTFIATSVFSTIPKITIYEFIGLLWLGIFALGLAFVFWFLSLKHGDTIEISNIVFLTPFLSIIYIFILLGEEILFSSIVGLILIIVGIYLNNKSLN